MDVITNTTLLLVKEKVKRMIVLQIHTIFAFLLFLISSCENKQAVSEQNNLPVVHDTIPSMPIHNTDYDLKFATVENDNNLIYIDPMSFEKNSEESENKLIEWRRKIEKIIPDSLKLKTEQNPGGIPEEELRNTWGDQGPVDQFFYTSSFIDSSLAHYSYYLLNDSGIYSLKITGTSAAVVYNLKEIENHKFKVQSTSYYGSAIAETCDHFLIVNKSDSSESYCNRAFVIRTPADFQKDSFELTTISQISANPAGMRTIVKINDADSINFSLELDNQYCRLKNYFVFKNKTDNLKYIFLVTDNCDLPCECWYYLLELRNNKFHLIKKHADQCDV